MSLTVTVWVPDDDAYAGRRVVDDPSGIVGVGGENSRYTLWGSQAARELGATLLPQLADITTENRGNLQVAPDQVDDFARECEVLADNVERLCAATGYDTDRVLHYLTNLRNAAERAKALNGGVLVW
jgi:hypothetical protein